MIYDKSNSHFCPSDIIMPLHGESAITWTYMSAGNVCLTSDKYNDNNKDKREAIDTKSTFKLIGRK